MSDSGAAAVFEFGPFRLDLEQRMLFREGTPLPATPKVYDLLVALVRRRGGVVTKDDLMSEVWPDAVVDDGSLARTVSRLRALLGQTGDDYIQTLPKRGYRFASDVRTVERRSTVKSIAVLPFTFLTPPDAAYEYLGIGLADAVITRLGGLRSLQVRPTSSVIRFGGSDAVTAGRELRVDAVIEGRIQIHGERMRLTTQLVTIASEKPEWAEVFDERVADLLELQDSLAKRLATALMLEIGGEDASRLQRRLTSNADAYRHFLRGRSALFSYAPDSVDAALRSFGQAVELDPSFAAAHAAIAIAYLLAGGAMIHPREAIGPAQAAAKRAVEIDESLADAHVPLAVLRLWVDNDPEGSEREFLRALQLAPNDPVVHHTYAWHLLSTQRFAAASAELERAVALDPTSLPAITDRGLPYYFGRDTDRALELFHSAIRLEPSFWYSRNLLGLALLANGQPEEALAEFENASRLNRGLTTEPQLGCACALARLGRKAEAETIIEKLQAKAPYVPPYEIAAVKVASGDHAGAIEMLERALADPDKWLRWIAVDPRFDSLRGTARFEAIRKRTGL